MDIANPTLWVAVILSLVTVNAVLGRLWRKLQDNLARNNHEDGVLIEVIMDRKEVKSPFAIEQMWNNLHSIGQEKGSRSMFKPQPLIGFEIHAIHDESQGKDEIRFLFWVHKRHKEMLVRRLLADYQSAQIEECEDRYYTPDFDDERLFAAAEMKLRHHYALSLRPYHDFEKANPMNAITSAMAELDDQEEMFLQVLLRPVDDRWREVSQNILKRYEETGRKPQAAKSGLKVFEILMMPFYWIIEILRVVLQHLLHSTHGPSSRHDGAHRPRPGSIERHEQESMSRKALNHHGYAVKIRCLTATPYGRSRAEERLDALIAAFNEVEADNALDAVYIPESKIEDFLDEMRIRYFPNDEKHSIISTIELAAFCHLPGIDNITPGIKRIAARQIARPTQVKAIDVFAQDDKGNLIGIAPSDRLRHTFIMGMTGVGKTTLIERMILNDIAQGRGVIVLDPHGDLAESVTAKIDSTRPDVYIFRPFDLNHPVGLNILEVESIDENMREMEKQLVVDSFITTLRRVFPPGSIGASSDDFFRMAASALVDQPGGASFLEVLLILTSNTYREQAVQYIQTPQVKYFWEHQFPSIIQTPQTRSLLAAPLNKTRRFVADRMVSRIICQLESTLNIKNIMDSGSVLICNLSQGLCGEENSNLLGAMLLAKIQIAAMMRAGIPEEQRIPCYVYVDEFQNFLRGESAASSFEKMLSEARKYRIALTMANQYLYQIGDLKEAIFGNCGSIVSFRVGPMDADLLEKYFNIGENPVTAQELKMLEKFQIAARLMADGITGPPMTAWTLPPVEAHPNANADELIRRSRADISVPRKEVEDEIMKRIAEFSKTNVDIN